MPHDNNRTLAIRALNAVRPIHVPTYLATRALFESIAGDRGSSWGTSVSPYKYALREYGRYYPAPAFKGLNEDGTNLSREFHIPSPTTLLAEATVLSALASSETFAKPENVYSYRWPEASACPYNFEHFINGFRLRQERVSAQAALNRDSVVVSLDLRKFYPSVNREEASRQFEKRLKRSEVSPTASKAAAQLTGHLLSELEGDRGIPTGPEFSHMLADCAFADFDHQFGERFGDNYFRYVDDLIFIVPDSEVDSTVERVGDTLGSHDYELHEGKEDRLPSQQWIQHVPEIRRKVREDSFEALVFKIKVFVSAKPKEIDSLREALRENGFRIPLQRLVSTSEDQTFREKLERFARCGWKVLWKAYRTTIPEIIRHASAVRTEISKQLEQLLRQPLHPAGIRRRWEIQRLRYNVNRAVYILDTDALRRLAADLSEAPEFIQFRTLIRAVFDEDAESLLQMPGATTNTAASLLRILKRRLKLPAEATIEPTLEAGQSLATLIAYDVIDAPDSLLQTTGANALLLGESDSAPPIPPFTFLDEFRLLLQHEDASVIASFLDSRFSSHEALALEALELDERGYS